MKLLFDECIPRKVKFLFADGGHECETVRDAGFSGKENGELLALAEGHFDVLVTILRPRPPATHMKLKRLQFA
jgi:predicted nuclease of predicted toxin-antitoxin system